MKPKKYIKTTTAKTTFLYTCRLCQLKSAPCAFGKALNTNQSSRHNLPKAAVTSSGQGMEGQTNKGERGRNLFSFP
jgi:hypothetical protein